MRFRNSADGYGVIPQTLHWLTVGLVVLAWALGTFDDALPKGTARAAGLFVHISAGLAILAVLAARLLWRLAESPAVARAHCAWRMARPRRPARPLRALCTAHRGSGRRYRAPVCARRRPASVRTIRDSFALARRPGVRTYRQGGARGARQRAGGSCWLACCCSACTPLGVA